MTNIFDFRPKKGSAANGDFLKDADDTVEFSSTGRDVSIGETSGNFLTDRRAALLRHDWCNQELANIYRVKKLLDAAGVTNTLERGISDEGDPWCIFCTVNGDVFIHLARVDGRYVLDSPNLRGPISGADFSELIAEFSDGALRTTAQVSKGSRRVIKLERNGKVFLHPAALLAALIWSIYLNSEDLVMFAPDEDVEGAADIDSIALVNETAMAPLSDTEAAEAARFMDASALPDHMLGARVLDGSEPRGDDLRDGLGFKEVGGKSAMALAPTPIAVGLSSIAIAFGIMSEGFFNSGEPDVDTAALDLSTRETATESNASEQEAEAGVRHNQFDLAAVLNAVVDLDHAPAAEDQALKTLQAELEAGIDLSTLLSAMLPPPELTDLPVELAGAFQNSWVDDLPVPALYPPEVQAKKQTEESTQKENVSSAKTQDSPPEPVEVVIATTAPGKESNFDFASLVGFKESFASSFASFQSFDVAGLTVEATFDIESVSPIASDLLLSTAITEEKLTAAPQPSTAAFSEPETINLAQVNTGYQQPPAFNVLDMNARSFIEFLMSRTKDIEILAVAQEIILIDFAAIEAASSSTHSMSWSLADGSTVSTIGLKSDFVEFDLIA